MPHLTRLSRAVTATAALAATTLAGAESARAGTYVIRNCNVPGYAAAPVGPWQSTPTANTVAFNQCASGGGFGFALSAPGSAIAYLSRATLGLNIPSDGPRRAIRLKSLRGWLISRLNGTGSRLQILTYVNGEPGVNAASGSIIEAPGSNGATEPYDVDFGDDTRLVRIALTCYALTDRPGRVARSSPDCYPAAMTPMEVAGIETTLAEDVLPNMSATGGTLPSDGPVAGPVDLHYSASDQESGLRRVELVVGDMVVASSRLDANCSYVDLAACPTTADGDLSFDTRAVPNGFYSLMLRAIDAAGNQRVVPLHSIEVKNDPAGVNAVGTSPAQADQTRLTAGFSGSTRPKLIASYGRKVVVRGKLTGAATHAIGDAVVDVLQKTTAAGAAEKAVGHVKTRADGTFSYARVVRGPSRTLRVTYHRTPGDPAPASSPALDLKVRAASTLHVSLHGVTVRFDGQVLSRPIPKAGKRVLLQGRAPGFAWAPFATVRSDRRGRFAGSYRLPVHRPGVKLQIRAALPVERGYPYLGHSGRPVTVHVR